MERLGINPIQLAAQIINVVILLVILRKYLYRPVLSLLEGRQKQIEQNIADEERLKTSLVKLEEQEKDLLKKSKVKSDEILRASQREAKKAAGKILADARSRTLKEKERKMKEFELELAHKRREFDQLVRGEAVKLANEALGKLLGDESQIKITSNQIAAMKASKR